MQNPGWSAQRHRRGRRFYESRQIQPQAPASRLSPSNAASKRRAADATPGDGRNLDKLGFASAGSGTPSYPASECPAIPSLARSGGSSRTPLECGCSTDRLVATQFSARKTAPSLPLLRPTVIDRAPWEIISDKLIVYRRDFLLRRGARNLERTALKPRGLPLRRAGGASRHAVWAIRARKHSLSARLGDSCYFAKSKIVESLLRRGARSSYPNKRELRSDHAGRP